MAKILIIGSEGFIGSHLVRTFLESGNTVAGCDLFERPSQQYDYVKISRLSPELDEIFNGSNYDVCINAAGSGNVAYSMAHPVTDFEANTLDTIRVLDTIRRFNKCRYIHISSAAVYGNPITLPVKEDAQCQPLSSYGWHKLMSEQACREYNQLYNIPVVIVRPFSIYGNGLKKQLLWDLSNKLKEADVISLFGTGNESRDFLHVTDLCRQIELIAAKDNFTCNIYNAASGEETLLKSLASIFEHVYDNKKQIGFSGEVRPGDPLNWRADIKKISALGFSPSVTLFHGCKSYIDWFKSLD